MDQIIGSDGDQGKEKPKVVIKLKGVDIDEALDRIEFGLFNYWAMFVSGMILNAVYMETCGISYVIAVSQCDLHLTQNEKGVLGAVAFFGIICSSYLWGYLADTYGRRRIIKPTLLVAFIFSVLSSITDNFYALVAFRFFTGFFISGSSATVYAYLSEFHGARYRDRALMGSAVVYGVSCLLLPLIAYSVINQDWQFTIPVLNIVYRPWRLFFIVCAIPGLFAHFALLLLPESPKFELNQGNGPEAIEIIKRIDRWNNGQKATLDIHELYEENGAINKDERKSRDPKHLGSLVKSIWIQTAPLFRPPHLGNTTLLCLIQFSIYYTSNGFYMFFNELLNNMANNLDSFTDQRVPMCETIHIRANEMGIQENTSHICVRKLEVETLEQGIILEALYALGFGIIGVLINRVGKFSLLFTLLAGSGTTGFICVLCDIPIVQVIAFIILMCSGMAANIVNTAIVDLYPTSLRATSVCIALMFGRLGSVIGSNVSAILLDYYCEAAFYFSGSSLIVCAVLTFFIPNIREIPSKWIERTIQKTPRSSIISNHSY